MNNVTIRAANAADLAACAKIINDWIDETDWMPRIHSCETIEGFFDESLLNNRTVFVAEENDLVGGYLSIDQNAMIKAIYLASAMRCRGVGKRLLDEAKKYHPNRLELGVYEINEHAVKFYQREGFEEVPEGRKDTTDEGLPELLMRWEGEDNK